eukprot:120580_1
MGATCSADIINDDDDMESKSFEKELQCGICLQTYTNPVKNIFNQVYCFHCIQTWFDKIEEEQTEITDPNTKQCLPHHCRLLIPHFAKMTTIWNYSHPQKAQIPEKTSIELQKLDRELDQRRDSILTCLKTFGCAEHVSKKLINQMIKLNMSCLNKNGLRNIVNNSLSCNKYFDQMKQLIKQGTDIYNDAMKDVSGDYKNDLCKWKEPKWENYIDKIKSLKKLNWTETYQIDEYLANEIETQTQNVISTIQATIQKQNMSSIEELQEKIVDIMVKKQKELFESHADEEMEAKFEIINKNSQYPQVKMERIMYSENNELVNTKCVKQIAACMRNNIPFELYHNTMNKGQLIRFLDTVGMNGIEYQHYIYDSFSMWLKQKMFRLCAFLKTVHNKESKNVKYFPYFKNLKSIRIIKQPITQVKQSDDWIVNNDKVELNVEFDVNYEKHLAIYNGDKTKLCKEIARQIICHLNLNVSKNRNVIVKINKNNNLHIDVTIIFPTPLLIANEFCSYLSKYATEPDAVAPWYKAMIQSMVGGGGIGSMMGLANSVLSGSAVVGGTTAASTGTAVLVGGAVGGAMIITPVGWALIGVTVGVVVAGTIGYLYYKYRYLQPCEQNAEPYEETDEKKNGEKENDVQLCLSESRKRNKDRTKSGDLLKYQCSVRVENVSKRVKKCGSDKYEIVLDCNCKIDDDKLSKENDYGQLYCIKCGKWSYVFDMSRVISGNGVKDRAYVSVIVYPQKLEDEFAFNLSKPN